MTSHCVSSSSPSSPHIHPEPRQSKTLSPKVFVQDLGSRLSDFSAALLSDMPDGSNVRTTASHHELAAASALNLNVSPL